MTVKPASVSVATTAPVVAFIASINGLRRQEDERVGRSSRIAVGVKPVFLEVAKLGHVPQGWPQNGNNLRPIVGILKVG